MMVGTIMAVLSAISLLFALLFRTDVVITSMTRDHEHGLTDATWNKSSRNYLQRQRRLLNSLESNPQFYSPSQQSQQQQSLDASNVFGMVFNVRSKVDETIQFTGFEFYTTPTDRSLYYQLYTKEGEYLEEDGSGGFVVGGLDTFELVSEGLIRASKDCSDMFQDTALYCTLVPVPDEAFIQSQLTISEKSSSRSFFITLASKSLVAQGNISTQERQQQRVGEMIVASTPELDLYEGIGTNTYPVSSNAAYFNDIALGFIGKLHYVNDDPQLAPPPSPPLTPQPTQSMTSIVTSSPTKIQQLPQPPTSIENPPTDMPQQPTQSPTPIGTAPTPQPKRPKCRPKRPCLNPPTPDTGDSVTATSMPTTPQITTIRTIVYVENTPERVMGERERSKYIEVMTKFLDQSTSLESNGVLPMNITVFNDDLVEEPDNKKKAVARSGGDNVQKTRSLPNDNSNATDSYSYDYNQIGNPYTPKIYPAIFVQTEFDVMTHLPYDVAAFYLWNEFRTNEEEELITLFRDNALFVSYFRDVTNVTVQVVNELIVPTAAPTIFVENTTIVDSENSAQQSFEDIWLYLGVTLGVVWFILTCCSLRHILKHRRGERYRYDLRRLRNQASFGGNSAVKSTSPREIINSLLAGSKNLARSKHRKKKEDEESPPPSSDGESVESFG